MTLMIRDAFNSSRHRSGPRDGMNDFSIDKHGFLRKFKMDLLGLSCR